VRKEHRDWLPQYPKESAAAYAERVKRTVLYDAYARSLETYAGLPFTNKIVVKDLPPELEYLNTDTDSLNSDLTSVCFDLLHSAIHLGVTHALVDFPYFDEENQPSIESAAIDKIRPYVIPITATNLIGWKTVREGGAEILDQIRILETETVADGEWGEKTVNVVRVVTRESISLYREDDKGKYSDTPDTTFPNNLKYVPLVTFYGKRTGHLTGKPALEGLAWQNLRHLQKTSDVDNIERMSCTPLLFGSGWPDGLDGGEIGPGKDITSTDKDAMFVYVETTGNGIPYNQKSIEKIEERMASLGADLVVRKSVDRQTLGSRKIDQSESISLLQVIVNRLEEGVSQIVDISADWVGIERPNLDVTIGDALNTPDGINFIDLLANFIIENDGMDVNSAVEELRRRGYLTDNYQIPDKPVTTKDNSDEDNLEDNNELDDTTKQPDEDLNDNE